MKDFIFVNLASQQTGAKPFDGMAAGSFTDMRGVKATFKPDELPTYVANTKASIMSTAGASGDPVGLPIDPYGHYHDENAAGWIINVELAPTGDKVIFFPRWTEFGSDLIGKDLQRFFSPTIDLKNKVIMGGSLTNWPASRTDKGLILLKPVELSMSDETTQMVDGAPDEAMIAACTAAFVAAFPDIEADEMTVMSDHIEIVFEDVKYGIPYSVDEAGVYTFPPKEEWKVIEMPAPEPEAAPAPEAPMAMPAKQPAISELSSEQLTRLEALIEERANLRVSEMLTAKERENRVKSFSLSITGKGFPIKADELTAFLSGLSDAQLETAERLFSRVVETGLIPLAELGHAQTMTGTKPLPALMATSLKSWLAAKGDMAEYFKVNAVELGSMADYDLTEYAPKEG